MYLFAFLAVLPIVVAIGLWLIPFRFLQSSMVAFSAIISLCAIFLFFEPELFSFSLNSFSSFMVIVLDVVLILYFLKEGLRFKDKRVWILALSQLILFFIAESMLGSHHGYADFVVDELSIFMFTVINIVGSLIVVFSVWYIDKEPISEKKKRLFLMFLVLFLFVMNLIVTANSLMVFFLLFELTTLASYLLIGFRKDELSVNNALKALWMNQIGGLFILTAVLIKLFFYEGNPYFNNLDSGMLIVVSFLAMAGLVKGAQMPFDSWLLGAMVAPSPVSAILHSATMVKLAPFIILKLAPAYEHTIVGTFIMIFGSFVFVVAGFYGLSRDKFKEILGYSTISLLGLMIAMATIVGDEYRYILYILIMFHAISKAMLFLLAGVLEKNYHVYNVSEMDGLLYKAPLTVGMIMFGFATITLPPFGLFFGKLFSIELVAKNLENSLPYAFLLVALAIGSAVLILLYFKVASLMFSKNMEKEGYRKENVFAVELIAPYVFTLMLIVTSFYMIESGIYVAATLAMTLIVPIWLKMDLFRNVDRVKEYHCGEQGHFAVAQWSFRFSKTTENFIAFGGVAAFASIVLGGLV